MPSSSSVRRSKKAGKASRVSPQRILGICLLIGGVSLFLIGMATPHTVDPLATTMPGSFSRVSSWYALGGIAIALTGFILAVFGRRANSVYR